MILPSSGHVVFIDENGDHGLHTIDASYPVFVLVACIFRKSEYAKELVPSVSELKFRWWGHDAVVLHSHEIRKAKGRFDFLFDQGRRALFMEEISALVAAAP